MKAQIKNFRGIALSILVFLASNIFGQEKIYMPYFTISGVHADYKVSTTKMLKTYIESTNRYQVILSNYIDTSSFDLNLVKVQKEAFEISANYFVLGDMNAVGNLLIISVKMYETSTGKLYWNDVIKANSLSDLDPSMQKIANNIGTTSKAHIDNDIATVTDYEAATNKTFFAQSRNIISIEGAFISNSVVKSQFLNGLGYTKSFDVKKFIFNISASYLWGEQRYSRMEVGLLYPLTSKGITPYIGGGLGMSTYSFNNNSSSYSYYRQHSNGLELVASGGALVMRNAAVGMRIGGTISLPAFNINNKYVPICRLSVGISF
ncbi:MAG: hypothetical protein WCK02_03805 [Bacteroidota bacterium]